MDQVKKLQKSIYRHMKSRALNLEGDVSKDLISYRKAQKRYSYRPFKSSSFEELLISIQSSHVIYLGDFHSFDQSGDNLRRLMKSLLEGTKKLSLGVEFVHIENQHFIDAFLKGYLTEIEFLEAIDYHDSWRFPWAYYRSFFDLAKTYNLKVRALNSKGTLLQRDQTAALGIQKHFQELPDHTLFVLFGELHIIKSKLPKEVTKLMGKEIEQTIIHQNLDEVYWKLNIENIEEDNQIIQFDKNEFSLQTSPPWIKYESMIYWYEHLCDDPDFDIHDYLLNHDQFLFDSNVSENFLFLCDKISTALGHKLPTQELEDFNLYDHQKLKPFLKKVESIKKKNVSSFFQNLVEDARVFRLPFGTSYYCSSYSINRLSYLVGLHIQDILLKKNKSDYEDILLKNNRSEIFIFLLYQISFSYFSSKVINPFRKCNRYLDFKLMLNNTTQSKEKQILETTLKVIEWNKKSCMEKLIKDKGLPYLYEVARMVGFYFGDVLYEDLYTKRSDKFNKVIELMTSGSFELVSFQKILRILLPTQKYKGQKKRFF